MPLLPFEKPLLELESQLAAATELEEQVRLRDALESARQRAFAEISPWERIQLSRHPNRPRMMDYVQRVFDDVIELHGDRTQGDDAAMICGIARFAGTTVFLAGQQKGISTDEKVMRNFGMAHPSGYRKARRIFALAERFRFPIVTLVDTPAAHPGVDAEQFGQGPAIADSLRHMMGLQVPVYSVILSEGGSGGALAIAAADWVAVFEHAHYLICPPERCAEILWRDIERKQDAAEALRGSAADLLSLGVVDEILPEANGGAHRDPDSAALALRESLARFLEGCSTGRWTPAARQQRFRAFGQWHEAEATGQRANA